MIFASKHQRRAFLAAALVSATACLLALPAFAGDPPTTVTFQANNPWAQELGSISNRDISHDYTVAIAAGKTLQINLVSRDPNVYFTVKTQDERKPLVDTFQTGATTWSTPNAAAATYTIHVYAQPDAMTRDEVAKYALQIGQYGAADMQPATTAVTFQTNNPWAQMAGSVAADAAAQDYTVAIAAGKTMQVNLVTQNPDLHFKVEDQGKTLIDTSQTGATNWSTPAATAATYTIRVYADPATIPQGQQAKYVLQIGQYGAQAAQPATPASAATAASPVTPASAGSASP